MATAKGSDPKSVVEAYVEDLNSGNAEAQATLVAEDVDFEGEAPGRQAFKERSEQSYAIRNDTFAAWSFTIDRVIVSGNDVAARLVLAVTLKNGKELEVEGMLMGTVKDGQFTWLATSLDAEDYLAILMLDQ